MVLRESYTRTAELLQIEKPRVGHTLKGACGKATSFHKVYGKNSQTAFQSVTFWPTKRYWSSIRPPDSDQRTSTAPVVTQSLTITQIIRTLFFGSIN